MTYVGFSTPRRWNPLSALIRWMTKSRTSHTWLLVEDPAFDLRLVLEAHTTGFRLISFTRFVKDNRVVALVRTSHPLEPGLPDAGQWLGESYDVLGLFGIFLTLVGRWFRQRPWNNPFPTPSALFCSEAVVRTLKAAGYPGSERLGDETTSPAALLEWFKSDPGCEIIDGGSLNLWTHLRGRTRLSAYAPEARPDLAPEPAAPEAAEGERRTG